LAPKMLSLFSGIGGIDLAAQWAGIETVAFCEIEPFCQKVLRKHWPDVPIFDDIWKLSKEVLEDAGISGIDIVAGGYPCQPFSTAGKRRGKEDDRHLWPEMFRIIQEIRPTWVIGENVAGHVTLGLDDVLANLESEGYAAQSFIIPAAGVGARHRRARVFVLAHSRSGGLHEQEVCLQQPRGAKAICTGQNVAHSQRKFAWGLSFGEGEAFTGFGGCCEDVANSKSERCGETGKHSQRSTERTSISGNVCNSSSKGFSNRSTTTVEQSRSIEELERSNWWAVEPNVGRVAHGVPARVDRLKSLGNAVVPQQIYPILAAIAEIEKART
jgi:DNA (cytosine-5)-methyltransferase 1